MIHIKFWWNVLIFLFLGFRGQYEINKNFLCNMSLVLTLKTQFILQHPFMILSCWKPFATSFHLLYITKLCSTFLHINCTFQPLFIYSTYNLPFFTSLHLSNSIHTIKTLLFNFSSPINSFHTLFTYKLLSSSLHIQARSYHYFSLEPVAVHFKLLNTK